MSNVIIYVSARFRMEFFPSYTSQPHYIRIHNSKMQSKIPSTAIWSVYKVCTAILTQYRMPQNLNKYFF